MNSKPRLFYHNHLKSSQEVNTMKRFLAAIVLVMLALVGCSSEESESYKTIELAEIEAYTAKGYEVIDVREPDEFAAGHIPDAQNLPLSTLQSGGDISLNKDGSYIIICRSGNRSQQASEILQEQGYSVVNVKEGMSSWTGPVSK